MIKVSILCSTYNQKEFIVQALDSFLMQKTDFDFEVLVHDDASTDGTTEIVKQYQKKYPNIFKPIYQKENQFSKGNKRIITKFLFPKARGKYLSLCEGDDFFTDENKLQRQVDFLDKNPDYALCFHPVRVFFESKRKKDFIFPDLNKITKFTLNNLLKENFIQTNSVMYRKQKKYDYPETIFLPGDWYLHIYHARFGKIGFINKVMSAYRRHRGGMWWNSYNNPSALVNEFGVEILTMHLETMALLGKNKKYKNIILDNFINFINYYVKLSNENYAEIKLKTKDKEMRAQVSEVQSSLDKIQSAKAYRIWQRYNVLKKKFKTLFK